MNKDRSFTKAMLPVVSVVFLFLISVTCVQLGSAAKDNNTDISITLKDASFAPLTTVNGNQILLTVNYILNDESLKGEQINGMMEIYYSNGTLIKSSSYPEGFKAKKIEGTKEFKTTIKDPMIDDVIANLTLTNLKKTKSLSNTLTTNVVLTSTGQVTSNGTSEQ